MKRNIKSLSLMIALMLIMSYIFVFSASAADVNYAVTSAIGATGETVSVSVTLSVFADVPLILSTVSKLLFPQKSATIPGCKVISKV